MVTLVAAIAERLIARGETVAVVESGAGGRVADLLTDRPGASAWFAGGIVAYSNASKRDVARVDSRLLDAAGAVSLDVARALALGARDRFGATWGLGEAIAERVRQSHREVEVTVIRGGQPHYPVLVGVE